MAEELGAPFAILLGLRLIPDGSPEHILPEDLPPNRRHSRPTFRRRSVMLAMSCNSSKVRLGHGGAGFCFSVSGAGASRSSRPSEGSIVTDRL